MTHEHNRERKDTHGNSAETAKLTGNYQQRLNHKFRFRDLFTVLLQAALQSAAARCFFWR
jgi:hypothetical protein